LDETNDEIWKIYSLVRDQLRVASTGEVIGLDHGAVLGDIELYTDNVKEMFESVLYCFQIEQEFMKT